MAIQPKRSRKVKPILEGMAVGGTEKFPVVQRESIKATIRRWQKTSPELRFELEVINDYQVKVTRLKDAKIN